MADHKDQHKKRAAKSRRKIAQKAMKRDQNSLRVSGTRFRLLSFQPLSLTLEDRGPFVMSIRGIPCQLALRAVHEEGTSQHTYGGTYIAIDFTLKEETDFLPATQQGLDLVEDFFSAVSLVAGATFREVEPIQIVCTDTAAQQKYAFVQFLGLSSHHWVEPISRATIDAVQGLLAHWDGLDNGKRLRRAARQFHNATGSDGVLAAFQYAYMGLEALEKPLADIMNMEPGVEVTQGKCDKCGAEYMRRRTVLAGVRAYISGALHLDMATTERKREWKSINDLRHDLFHSLKDNDRLEQEARDILPVAMHALHDALCCLSHAHSLESSTFRLARGMRRLVLVGQFKSAELGRVDEWQPLLDSEHGHWVEHPEHGFVPRFRIRNPRFQDLEGVFFWVDAPLRSATKDNLLLANWENSQKRA